MRQIDRLRLAGKCPRAGNAIERAVALGSADCPCGGFCRAICIPENGAPPGEERTGGPRGARSAGPFCALCAKNAGDKLAAARILGIGKTTLYRKLKQYHMEVEGNT